MRGVPEGCVSHATAGGDTTSEANAGERMDMGAALAGRASRGGDCLRTDSRLYLYSATWRRSSDPATDCRRSAARDRASNDDCSGHQLRTGNAIRRTTEQLRAERGSDRRLPAKEHRRRWLEFARIKFTGTKEERSSNRKRRCFRDNGGSSFRFGSSRRCAEGDGRQWYRDSLRIAVE